MGSNTRTLQIAVIFLAASSASMSECQCFARFNPVCATNGEVFSNECTLKCFNSENHQNLGILKTGHCSHPKVGGSDLARHDPEKFGGGAMDVCLFTKGYSERFSALERSIDPDSLEKEDPKKSKPYFRLLAILCSIECAIIVFVNVYGS